VSGSVSTLSQGPLLAFDTSGSHGSVAIGRDGTTLARITLAEPREHAASLVPAIDQALVDAAVSRSDLCAVVVGEGPGSFTGVRVAAATGKGLVHALGIPLRAVSSLQAAAMASDVGSVRYVLFDARGDRVYGACYGVGSAEVQELVAPHGGTLRDVLAADVPPGAVFLGEGAQRHRGAIEGAGFTVAPPSDDHLGEGLLRFVAMSPSTPTVADPASWEPAYVRAWSGAAS
jgi:tRNA threonylcarbamoyl adenosine modification protein YeaZ